MKYELDNKLKRYCALNLAVDSSVEEKQLDSKEDVYSGLRNLAGRVKIVIESNCKEYKVEQPLGKIETFSIAMPGRSVTCDLRIGELTRDGGFTNIDFNSDETDAIFLTIGRCLESRFRRWHNNDQE